LVSQILYMISLQGQNFTGVAKKSGAVAGWRNKIAVIVRSSKIDNLVLEKFPRIFVLPEVRNYCRDGFGLTSTFLKISK